MEIEETHGNTYVVDCEHPDEMARLIVLGNLYTQAMGGPLALVPELPFGAKIVDLACGPGGWVLDVAHACPDCEVAGVDISELMLGYAKACAASKLKQNVSFGKMDITQPLDFSDNTFDLVNARLLVAVLRREHWEPFLDECMRILKPGGILRLTEPVEPGGDTTSKAYQTVCRLMMQILWRHGYGFSVDGYNMGVSPVLPSLLRRRGYTSVRIQPHMLEFAANTQGWRGMYDNMLAGESQMEAFFSKTDLMSMEEVRRHFQQAHIDWHSPEFGGMMHFFSALGQKPVK